jgi:hypothetical protein
MKLQIDVDVRSPEHAYEVLEEVASLIDQGETNGAAADMEGVPVGRFELFGPSDE